MIILGVLFFIYISNNPLNIATNFIFLGAGVLIVRRAYESNKKSRLSRLESNKKQKSGQGKSRRN